MSSELFKDLERNPVFTCPHCSKYQSHQWEYAYGPLDIDPRTLLPIFPHPGLHPYDEALKGIIKATCNGCDKISFWLKSRYVENELQIYPSNFVNYPPPHEDLPENVKKSYIEAGSVASLSPGASAALARLTLENLLTHLGYNQKTLNDKIKEFVEEKPHLQKTMDLIRVYGNSGAHSGTIDLNENKEIPIFLLQLINVIVEQTITIPNSIESLYEAIPNGIKKQIIKRGKK